MRTEDLLKQSQLLTSELQARQEELTATNGTLEQQAASLRQSEELLRAKQEELQQTNAELEEKAVLLSAQNTQVEAKNREVEQAKLALEEKAEQLALTSKYKSEFLANMSHELRTPLNSLLILSKMLSENTQGNLSSKQVEFAKNIHAAGSDLLGLINDILDLSKIESGTVTLDIGETSFASLREQMNRTFAQIAQDKKLEFAIEVGETLPPSMYTDDKRLLQIIKNLLSNAFKFTASGAVRFKIDRVEGGWTPANEHLNNAGQVLAFSVEDSGIGIPEDKQRIIFEAFQQADGTTSRKYGGTGLGLSISREITRTLGGELKVESELGRGSTFTLYLPLNFSPTPQVGHPGRAITVRALAAEPEDTVLAFVPDDREQLSPGEAVILIVEDDPRFAGILLSLVRDAGFKGVITRDGAAAPGLARRFSPQAIMLDIGLPDMDGLALLDLLKRMPDTRHIPVHVISADDQAGLGVAIGAFGVTAKPVDREGVASSLDQVRRLSAGAERRVLLLGSEGSVAATLKANFGEVTRVATLKALAKTAPQIGDCLIIETSAAPIPVLVEFLKTGSVIAVLYAPGEISAADERRLRTAVFRGHARLARTPDQLLEQATLLRPEPTDQLPEAIRLSLAAACKHDTILRGRTALVIDDDIRNIFSMASVLEEFGVDLRYAESGRAGLDLLRQQPDVDIVLVDIMMPDMDGYETMREIRSVPRFADLPIIAVTAKAMKGDRLKCIQAGASDYVSKPVDIDHLISVMRVSLQRTDAARMTEHPEPALPAGAA
jgi:signal transduction histidine kinase/DNA-binding response OmpR family regulator